MMEEENELNGANEHLEELRADRSHPANRKRSVGMNTEIVSAIVVLSISLIWFLISWLIIGRIYHSNMIFAGIGGIVMILGLIKRNRVKNTDLDF